MCHNLSDPLWESFGNFVDAVCRDDRIDITRYYRIYRNSVEVKFDFSIGTDKAEVLKIVHVSPIRYLEEYLERVINTSYNILMLLQMHIDIVSMIVSLQKRRRVYYYVPSMAVGRDTIQFSLSRKVTLSAVRHALQEIEKKMSSPGIITCSKRASQDIECVLMGLGVLPIVPIHSAL